MKPYYQDDAVTIYHGDCREIMPQLGEVDHIITDPPYDDRTHKGARGGAGDTVLIDFAPITGDDLVALAAKMTTYARRWVLMTCDWRHAARFEGSADLVRLGVWVKPNGAPQFTGDRPGTGWEAIALLHREGKKRWNNGGHHAVWTHNIEQGEHPTQKPLALVRQWVEQFTDDGETVLDPFMGSGTTLRAAKDMHRRAIGIELDERYCELAARRMGQEVLNLGAA